MSEQALSAFSVKLPSDMQPEVALVGVYAPHLAVTRPIPHYKAVGPLAFRMGVNKSQETLGEHQHMVKLAVAAELVQPDGQLVLRAEVHLEAVAVCVGLAEEALAFQLDRALPARLFAHARVHIESLTRDSGYQPITLPPVPLDPKDQPGAAQ